MPRKPAPAAVVEDNEPVEEIDAVVDDTQDATAAVESDSLPSETNEPADETEVADEPPPSQFSLREAAAKSGLNLQAENDEAAYQQLLAHMARQQQAVQQAQWQIQENARQWAAYQQQQQQPQPAPEPKKPSREVPEFDPNWLSLVRKDPVTGDLVAVPGAEQNLPQKIRQWADWKEQQELALLRDPAGYILPLIQEQIDQRVAEQSQAIIAQAREQASIQQAIGADRDWIYAQDPMTGQQVFSPDGERYFHYAREAAELGIMGAERQIAYARRMLAADLQNSLYRQSQAQNGHAATNQQLKQNALTNGASRVLNRGGSIPKNPNAPPQNVKQSFREMLAADLENGGVPADLRL